MANASTITTTIQTTGSVSVPQQNQSFVEANATAPGYYQSLALNNTPTALTIPANTSQVIINATGATVSTGTPLYLCIGGTGVALQNMFRVPLGTIATSTIGTTNAIKLPVISSSPVLLLACDDSGAHSCGLTFVGVWFL